MQSRAPPRAGTVPTIAHHYTHSQEEQRRPQTGRINNKQELDIFASPPRGQDQPRRPRPHVRRNSESSMMDAKDDDRRRGERRAKERDPAAKDKDGRSKSRRTKPVRGLDIIDKLDVSSLYGPGCQLHASLS